MTALTTKERAKVNAALCMIHDSGLDAQAVVGTANAAIAAGQAPAAAYTVALNGIASGNPTLGVAMGKVTRLIEASSPATVDQYDHALSQYIDTGSDTALTAMASTIAADSVALAIATGEMTEADAANRDLSMALGAEPTAVFQQAYTPPIPATEAQPDASAVQVSPVEGAGFVAMGARTAHAHYSGFVPDAPTGQGLNPAAAKEAARASASRVGSFTAEAAPQAG